MTTLRPTILTREEDAIADHPLRRIAVDGAELEYEERGSGEPVLLIHGSVLADAFAPLLAERALTERYRVISYHRRGFAGSARPRGEVSIARQAADARGILTGLGIARAHVVGHSYGGAIALQLAHDAPEVVHSLSLLEPALFAVPSGEQFIATVFAPALARYAAGDQPGSVDTVLRGVAGAQGIAALKHAVPGALELAATDASTFFETELPALQGWRFGSEEARRIGMPVLAVRGADSDTVAPTFGEGIALLREWLPQATTFVVPAATHGMPFMNPGSLAQGLSAFFAHHSLHSQIGQCDDLVTNPNGTPSRGSVFRGLPQPATVLGGSGTQGEAQQDVPVANASATGPVKLVALYGPPTDAAAFERYYAETHVPLAHKISGLQRVETALLLGTADGGTAPYHRIAELWFSDIGQFQAAVASPEGQALAADVANFATGGLTVLVARIDEADAAAAGAATA
jgi:uncharacterized protein (TIGR02118 family)